jgi:hypothetical protein
MRQDFSWAATAAEYVKAYRRLTRRGKAPVPEPKPIQLAKPPGARSRPGRPPKSAGAKRSARPADKTAQVARKSRKASA